MAKLIGRTVLLLMIVWVGSGVYADTVKNQKPLKGEWNFKLEQLWDVDSAGDDILTAITSIRVGNNGNVFVFDRKMAKFYVFSPEGKFLYSFGKRGEGPGEYKFVFNFNLFGNRIMVPDQGKLHVFSMDGKFIESHNLGSMTYPMAYIDKNRFLTIKSDIEEKAEFDRLQIYHIDSGKRTTIAEIIAEKALRASAGGIQLAIKDSSTTPSVILDYQNNALYFGKSDKYFIKKTDLTGKELMSFSLDGRERKNIPEEFKRKRFENISLNGGKMPKEMVDQMIKGMPDESTFFNRIQVEDNGLIYVFVNDITYETGQELDVFSPRGEYLYHGFIKLPDGLIEKTPYTMEGDYLYLFGEDEDGIGKLIKFKISKPAI